jgi:arylsulfatase A-like enzyme
MYSNLDPVETVYFGDEGVPSLRNGEVVKRPADPAELTRIYTDEAIAFLEANRENPFFLYLPHTMLHKPLGVSPEFVGSSEWGEYGDAIQELDHHVGRLIDALEELGLGEETLVLYASDNGRGSGRNPSQPMKGNKLTTWECGIRVPAIVWGPGVGVEPGEVCGEIVHAMDWYPTFATAAGIRIGEDHPVIDGRDLWPMLTGETEGIPSPSAGLSLNAGISLRRRWDQGLEWEAYFDQEDYLNAFFYHGSHGALAAVRSGDYKLFLNPQLTIYDLEKDPGETTPIRKAGLVKRLRGMAVMFQEEMSRDARKAGFAERPNSEQE